MTKAIVHIGYKKFVVEVEEALVIAKAVIGAELYETRGYGEDRVCHIWPQAVFSDTYEVTFISDEQYRLGKLAGEPPKK